jgi:DNA-binding transcriptional MerR regulator
MGRVGLFIGELAGRTETSAKTIRYYESIGLLPRPPRGENRYRLYSRDAVKLLAFIKKAQGLGFTLAEIKEILTLRRMGREPCLHVRALVGGKLTKLDRQLNDLIALRRRLKRLFTSWEKQGRRPNIEAAICPRIEGASVRPR